MTPEQYQKRLESFLADVRDACKAFKTREDWPKGWLLIDGGEEEWYDVGESLFGIPVFRTPARLTHSGHDGEGQVIIPLWQKEISDQDPKFARIRREFEARLAKSGDF